MAAPRRKRPPSRPGPTSGELLAMLRDPAQERAHRPALRELARRPAEPELVEIVPGLDAAGLGGSIGRALLPLGALLLTAGIDRGDRVTEHFDLLPFTAGAVSQVIEEGARMLSLIDGVEHTDSSMGGAAP